MIYKITVFKDGVRSDLPSLIFWVKDAPNVQKRANNSEMNESSITSGPNYFAGGFEKMKILNTSTDGKSVLREHIIRAVAV
ncbi:hypothetical protein BKA66DRAFT_454447 [Pyrenochaeta sp. MPI-SDFR-AT-0127]|nr:hypothetical protein BKA66DRAFT_454447 [Pyrenochaeta sp. MPI-SDFR-AT-0127]